MSSDSGNWNVVSISIPRCSSSDSLNLSLYEVGELCSEGGVREWIPNRSGIIGGRMRSRASLWDPFCRAKKHMGFFLRQYPWPLAMQLRAKREIVCNQTCQLTDFWRKGKQCGATLAGKVPTHGFSEKKEVVWCDLPAIFHHSAKKEGGATSKICQKFFISLLTSTD